jgi:hypothetical protein
MMTSRQILASVSFMLSIIAKLEPYGIFSQTMAIFVDILYSHLRIATTSLNYFTCHYATAQLTYSNPSSEKNHRIYRIYVINQRIGG